MEKTVRTIRNVRVELLPELIAALQQAEAEARAAGLLKEPEAGSAAPTEATEAAPDTSPTELQGVETPRGRGATAAVMGACEQPRRPESKGKGVGGVKYLHPQPRRPVASVL